MCGCGHFQPSGTVPVTLPKYRYLAPLKRPEPSHWQPASSSGDSSLGAGRAQAAGRAGRGYRGKSPGSGRGREAAALVSRRRAAVPGHSAAGRKPWQPRPSRQIRFAAGPGHGLAAPGLVTRRSSPAAGAPASARSDSDAAAAAWSGPDPGPGSESRVSGLAAAG